MVRVAVIYHSVEGHTKMLTDRFLNGVGSVEGVEGQAFTADEALDRAVLDDLSENYTAIIFGAPTFMGSPPAKFKEFMEGSSGVFYRKL
jgi:multimeric flavodoxin WrbA